MPITILSPYSGNPVKVRDQDIERAIRDEEGRIFYVVQSSSGGGYYASMTRNGSAKDEERYRELQAKTARQGEVARATVAAVHDATGKPRGGVGRLVVILILLAIVAAAGYFAYTMFGDELRDGSILPEIDVPSLPSPTAPQIPPAGVPEPAATIEGAGFRLPDGTLRTIEGSVGAALARGESAADTGDVESPGTAANETPPPAPEAPFIETASGVKYRIETPGHGAAALAGNYVLIHYETLTPHGLVLDSTRDARGQGDPIGFVLCAGQVIEGWDIGIAGMKIGERRTLLVPARLVQSPESAVQGAESADGSTPQTPASGIDLRFHIELVDVLPGVLQHITRQGNVGGRVVQPGEVVELSFAAYLDTEPQPFDTSETRGQPLRFRLTAGEVIQGLDLGVVGMKEGEKRSLVIPPYLAYGQRGITGLIPPNATLRYELELLRAGL